MAQAPSYQNRILSRLSKSDFQLLEPHLEPIDLPVRKVLERRGKPIKAVYFPETGFASVVANGDTRRHRGWPDRPRRHDRVAGGPGR